ncbi:MAG: secretin and TonB N-terminal domain-containing protein [Acidobacteria bacterium]|nr:secretin and TonB N-terminal domain-containing protein [Acidobacteriota bacterium]
MVWTTIRHDKILLPIVTLIACGLHLYSAGSGPETSALTPSPQAVQESRYEGEPVSLKVVGISLVDFFRTISELSGLNFLIDPEVTGSLTLNVEQVPWDQLFDSVLQSQGLVRSIEGSLVRISTQTRLIQEQQIQRQLKETRLQAEEIITVSRRLNYATAAELLPILQSQLSPRGSINVDIRTNTLIITDIPSAIERLLGTTDSRE